MCVCVLSLNSDFTLPASSEAYNDLQRERKREREREQEERRLNMNLGL